MEKKLITRYARLIMMALCWLTLSAGVSKADSLRITGGFTTFSGVIVGGGSTFIETDTILCAPPACPAPQPVCPDAGCGVVSGQATNVPLGSPTQGFSSGTDISFWVSGAATNELSFHPAGNISGDPTGEFKLGTLSFENGSWSGPADFGFSIFVTDTSNLQHYDFTGFVHMNLTANTAATAAQRADYVYLTDAAHNVLSSPLTHQTLGSVRAFELGDDPSGNVVSVDLMGTTGSLDPTRFVNVTGGGFLDISTTDNLGGPPPDSTVPEPGTVGLMSAVLFGLVACVKRSSTIRC